MADEVINTQRKFKRDYAKYSLDEKEAFGKLVAKYKTEYDDEVKRLKGKTRWDGKRKKHVQLKPKDGSYISKSVRIFYADLKNAKHDDQSFKSACALARRCYKNISENTWNDIEDENESAPPKKRFRESGGGRKAKAPEVRDALFEWFLDVRGALKGRLPMKIFLRKCREMYQNWLEQQGEHIPEKDRLKFGKHWVTDWCKEYSVSLRKPNKRFAIGKEDRIERLEDYLKNVWTVRKYFIDTYGVDPPVINGDQMPLHRNESASQKTMSLKDENVFVKENYMLSRERVTVFTQVSTEKEVNLKPEFVFKGVGTRTHLHPPEGIKFQWAPKGSYRIEQMLGTIKNLPKRSTNLFTMKDYAIYVLDDYAVHLLPEVRKALLKQGYVLIVIGGGITGDVQINDTHIHHQLKTNYREQEMEMMLRQLEENPTKIPAPSRDEMMLMLSTSWENMVIDEERAFKTLFVTNAFDGSEDYLVSDKLFQLVGPQMVEFREKLMKSKPPKSFQQLLRQIIPPKGIRRKNLEGSEMFDCEDEEIEEEDEVSDVDDDENDVTSDPEEQVPAVEAPVTLVTNSSISLTRFTNDPDIIKDALFLDKLEELIKTHKTSKVFTPHISQFKVKHDRARKSLKRRIEVKNNYFTVEENMQEEGPSQSRSPTPSQSRSVTPIYNSSDDESSLDESSLDDHQENASLPSRSPSHTSTPGSSDDEDELADNTVPQVDECWMIRNGNSHLYATIASVNPLLVKYFEPTRTQNEYRLVDTEFEAFPGDFMCKTLDPVKIPVGQHRVYYYFL